MSLTHGSVTHGKGKVQFISWKTAAIASVAVCATAFVVWSQQEGASLPEGIVQANGRIEAERIDIATKFPGRIVEILTEEGAFVSRGDLLARLDDEQAQAELREAKANIEEESRRADHAAAVLRQHESELTFAKQELRRSETLLNRDFATQEVVDQRRSQVLAAEARVLAARAEIARTEAAIEGAVAHRDRLNSILRDHLLTAPRDGRVQYRLATEGEVLGSGGRVLTLLDLTDVYMTVFLPTTEAGRLTIGDEARIVLDAASDYVIPARVSFVAAEAQFTPKYVETEDERQKLMFRVKVKIDPDLLRKYQRVVKTGLPGLAYLRTSSNAVWPETLTPRLPAPPAEPAADSLSAN